MQVDPGYPVVFAVDPTLAFRDFQLLKLKYDRLLSNFACFAVNCNLRHYTAGEPISGGTWKEEFFRLWACRDRWVAPAVDEVERVKERFRRMAAGEDPTAVDAEIDAAVGAGGGG